MSKKKLTDAEINKLGNKGKELTEGDVELLCGWVLDEIKKLDEIEKLHKRTRK